MKLNPTAFRIFLASLLTSWLCLSGAICTAQWGGRDKILKDLEKQFGEPPGGVRLDPKNRVWADKKNKLLVVDGYVALRTGQLEMLACLVGTKEHESVVAVFSNAQTVHAGLLAIGADQGKPVKWDPYVPPSGSEIQVFALWRDEEGNKKKIDTREWVRVVGTEDDTLATNWVFAGSMMWTDPDTGEQRYQAESGDLICVSNFSTATLDVPIESMAVNSGLMFAAFTERIPKEGTPIRLVLQVLENSKSADTRSSPSRVLGDDSEVQKTPDSKDSSDALQTGESTTDASDSFPSLERLLGTPN